MSRRAGKIADYDDLDKTREQEAVRDQYVGLANRYADDPDVAADRYHQTIPASESKHPALNQKPVPQTRQYGAGNGVSNDEAAAAAFAQIRHELANVVIDKPEPLKPKPMNQLEWESIFGTGE